MPTSTSESPPPRPEPIAWAECQVRPWSSERQKPTPLEPSAPGATAYTCPLPDPSKATDGSPPWNWSLLGSEPGSAWGALKALGSATAGAQAASARIAARGREKRRRIDALLDGGINAAPYACAPATAA